MNNQVKKTNALIQGKTKFRQLLCISALCAGSLHVGTVAADEQQAYGTLSKQLDIMNNIFVSSLTSQQGKSLKNTRIDSLYLAGQGAVFTIKSADSFAWSRDGFSFAFTDAIASLAPLAPIAPVAPRPSSDNDISFEYFDDNDELADQMESAYEQQREHNRQLREQQRELAYELRDLERESRDLAYQVRNVSKEEQKKLIDEQKSLSVQKAELEKTRVTLNKKSQEMKKQQQINQSKKLAARKEHYQKLTTSLVETLCTYGNSLKALPKNEYVSLVLKSAGDKVAKGYQDKVFVLTKKNITECAIDKISAEKLLASIKSYQF